MRKLLSLLVVLLASLGFTAWAQTMPFEAATSATDPDAQMYYIYQPGSQEYVKVTNGNILGSTFTGDQFIFVASNDANLFYVYNKSCGKFLTYTQTTDNGVSTKLTSQSVVKLVDTKDAAKTWRFVQEGSTDCFDIFPGEVASPNGNTASWNFRGGPDYALNFYKASDNNSSWQILGEIAGNMRCANKVFSLPGKPFMHKLLPNDGDEVLGVENLPPGLELKTDRPGYKYIYGTAPAAGEYTYKVNLSGDKSVDVGFTVSPDLTQPTPFMGVLTWNAFQGHINDNNIMAIADAFETFGLKDLGYNYMCIDDQWAAGSRSNGHLTWGTKFTDHAGVVDYVHNKGLKIGIYSDAGSSTCSGAQPGSYGYEVTDANDFLDWDFDLLKYDFCNATGGTSAAAAENAYKAMGDALKNAAAAKGKDFLFYMCEWGKRQPWEWGANTGATCWRATDDTRDYWSDTKYRGGVIQVLDIMKNIWAYQGVNRWNDADMLVVGLHGTGYSSNDGGGAGYSAGLTMDEARTNFALWCMFASPLTLSNNITNLDGQPNNLTGKNVTNNYYKEDLAIIRNKELIDLDQDPLGQAGEPIYDTNDYIVFQKDMADGSIALSITNLSSAAKDITVNFADLSALKSGEQYKMRDLWQHAYLDTDATSGVHKTYTTSDSYTVNVPKHGTFVYRIQRYDAEDLTWTEPTDPVVPEPETPVEGEWISEYPQTSTIAEPILYRIHNLGGDDGSYKGNDVYVQTQQSGIRFCDANGEADEFVFIDGGNSTVYIYDNTTSKYISWTTDAEGSCGWSGGKAINVVTRVQAVDDQASAKTWAIVDDENTAGRYDIKPTASSNNSWSYYGGVDQESVVLNLESKINRNCKWMFERKVANAPEVEETAYVTASELRAKAATGRFAILGVTTTGDHYLNGAITGHVSTGGTLAGVREPNADEIVYFVSAGNNQYYIQREDTKKYFQIAAGGDINLVDDASNATSFTVYGKDETGYATGAFDDLFSDLTKAYNDYMIRFKANGQWLNTRSVSEVGGLRTGTGAWSFQYVRYLGEQGGSSVDPETPVEGEWVTEFPKMSTDEDVQLYYIHNIGADGSNGEKGNDVYLALNNENDALVGKYVSTRDEASQFYFLEDENGGIYIVEMESQAYISYSSNVEGQVSWNNGGSITRNPIVIIPPFGSQDEPKTWKIVQDENVNDRYDILPNEATANYGWSFMGGVDRAWVRLNLEDKTNRNCKWVFERQGNGSATPDEDNFVIANSTTGSRNNQGGNYFSVWTRNDDPVITLTAQANNMNYSSDGCLQLHKGTAGNGYTIAAPEGYVITGYSATISSNDDNVVTPTGLSAVTATTTGAALNVTGLNAQTATFNITGQNTPVKFADFKIYYKQVPATPVDPDNSLGAVDVDGSKYPFVLSTSADDLHWHYLTIRGNKYVSYNATTQQFDNSTTAPSGDAGLFAFVPVSENGVKIINKAAGLTKALGGAITNNGKISTVNYADGLEFIYKNNEGHDVFGVVGNANAHVNDVQSHLGFWLDGASATDDGSTFTFTPIEVLVSTNDVKHYYTIRNANPDGDRDKTYAHYEAANQYLSLGTERNNKTVFYFTSAGDNANGSQLVHIHSYLAEEGLTMANFNEWNTSNKAWYVKLANGTSALTDFNIGFNADYSSSWNHQTGGVKSWSAGADKGSAWYIEEVFEKTYTLDLSAADVEGYTLYNNGQAYTDGQQITGFFFDAASFTTDAAGEHPFDGTLSTVDGTLVFGFEEFSNILAGTRPAGVSKYTLWYDEPSSKTTAADKWMDYGLPIGNGQVGAVLAGDLLNDEIQFNEKSLWRGDSRYNGDGGQGYYQNFGFINVKDLSGNFSIASTANPVKGYNRYLDIVNGVAGVNYESETTHFERTFITSAPDRVFAAHYTADGDQKLHLKFAFTPDTEISAETPVYGEGGTASFGGKLATVSYNASFKVVSTDGQVTRTDDGIEVSDATDVTLYMAAGTNFDITNTSLVNGDKGTVKTRNEGLIAAAEQKGWAAILDGHKADFSEYMNRVDIQFGDADSEKNTKELIDLYATPANRSNADGLFLEQLYYTYGRYLAVAGNRINDTAVPTNLQGIWNKYSNSSFWHCDLHADINVEMNYWPMEAANLSEMHRPFLDHILGLSKEGYAWRDLAKRVKSDARGWTIGTENNIFGGRSNFADNLKTQSAWYCSHLWQHYQYTQDKDFLREAFPTMLSSLQFLMDISTLNTNDNTMEVLHEWSPEHGDGNQVTAYAQQCVAENIKEVLAAVDILGSDVISAEDLAEIVAFDKVADKGLNTETYNGKTCLKEWKYLPLSHNDPAGHRHLSHLMALYPFSLVSAYDTENGAIYEAAKNSLHVRNGGDVTGWSMGWKTNCYARTLEGDEAHNYLAAALRHVNNYKIAMAGAGGCYYNLWDAHSPFQIDGNFGVTAGVNEMLLQSYDGTIHLLPALPSAWADGHAKGLKAIGNFTVDQTWEGGKLTEATVTSVMGGELRVQYGEELLTMMTYPGETYNFYFNDGKFSSYLAGATIVNVVEHVKAALEGNDDLDGIDAAKNAVLGISGRK